MPRTISAYVSDLLAERYEQVVAEEARKPARVAARAIDLYALLPVGARRAVAYVREHGTAEELEELVAAITSGAAQAPFRVAEQLPAVPSPSLLPLFSPAEGDPPTSSAAPISGRFAARRRSRDQ